MNEKAMDSKRTKGKEKRRSNEKRKEKSRDAARCRRSKETDIFTDLAGALPLEADQAAHLDKASVMRLAIAYLKVRSVTDSLEKPPTKIEKLEEMDALFPQALDGFMLVISSNGDMVYLSENVSDYLGVSQMDMMGQSVYEYSHPCDHDELRECLTLKPIDVQEKRSCNFFLRLKCTLTSKGRKVNLKSASYKVIHCTGRAMGNFEPKTAIGNVEGGNNNRRDGDSSDAQSNDEMESDSGYGTEFGYCGASIVVVGCPVPHPSNIEVPLGRHTFLSKHSLNMKFTYADERLAEHLGWTSSELLGKSVFEFHHALDNTALHKSFKLLFNKGQCETTAYRFLGKKGGYAWVVTQATLIHCSKQHKPLSVVCVNHILSDIECEDVVYSERQLKARKADSLTDIKVVPATDIIDEKHSVVAPLLPQFFLETPSPSVQEDSNDDEDVANDLFTADVDSITAEYVNAATIFEPDNGNVERSRPQSVTASLFRSQVGPTNPEEPKEQSVASKIVKNSDIRIDRLTWLFQDKPILEYEPPPKPRPQSVTKSLFAPVCSNQDATVNQQPQPYDQTIPTRPTPHTATASIFAPRTEDMSKGFLTFSDDQPGLTMLKDEPEDLTHLAPTPGDVCVSLEDNPFLSDDMLDEFILANENYCPLLNPDGLTSSELVNSDLSDPLLKVNGDIGDALRSTLADADPFIYRNIASPCSLSSDLLSPVDDNSGTQISLGQSPEQSMESFESPKQTDIVDGMMAIGNCAVVGNPITEDEILMLSINDVVADDELALRAPYIPMSDQDEALQLLISDDTVMWGPTQPQEKKTKWYEDEKSSSKRYDDSSLVRLLKNDTGPTKFNDQGGGLVDPAEIFGQIAKGNTGVGVSSGIRFERPSKRSHPSLSTNPPIEPKRSRLNVEQTPTTEFSMSITSSPSKYFQTIEENLQSRNNYDEQTIDLGDVLSAEENIDPAMIQPQRGVDSVNGGSQLLLQQLMSRDNVRQTARTTKSRESTGLRIVRNECVDLFTIVDANVEIFESPTTERKGTSGKIVGEGDGDAARESSTNVGSDSSTSREGRQSNSVLMNLLVSGCDKSSGLRTGQRADDRWMPMIIDDESNDKFAMTNNRSSMPFVDEYAAVDPNAISARSADSVNYFNRYTPETHLRFNPRKSAFSSGIKICRN